MTVLVVTRGLPGCGKTTWATQWRQQDPQHRVRINLDDFRAMMHGNVKWGQDQERQTLTARNAAITGLLQQGVSVVVDDTNLPARKVRDLRRIAKLTAAEFQVQDMTNVPIEEVLEQNSYRADKAPIPEQDIMTMYQKWIVGQPYPLPIPDEEDPGVFEPYVAPVMGRDAIIVDIDGTLALKGDRSPYDESRVHEDRPNPAVVKVVHNLGARGFEVVLVSGRTEACREATELWLRKHLGVYEALFMRKEGDRRPDYLVKGEIFDREIRHVYRVMCVIDDRKQVVDMWRSIGLTVLQCAEGNF